MDDLPDVSNLASLNAEQRLRLLADIAVREAKAAATIAAARAEMKVVAIQMGALLFRLRQAGLTWTGEATECLMAERPRREDDSDDEHDESWPVHVENSLLARVRSAGFDLYEVLLEHGAELSETNAMVVATPACLPSGEWFAAFTMLDSTTGMSSTHVFTMARKQA